MKNLLLTLCCSLTLITATQGQLYEEALFTHYTLNPALINPGATGFHGGSQAFMNIRSSWAGFPGAPNTYALSYNGALGKVLGLGASILSENIASLTSFRFMGGIGTRFDITKDLKVAGGLSFEVSQRRLSDAILENEFYDVADPIVEANIDGVRFFDMAFGFFSSYKDKTYFGASFPNMILSKLDDISSTSGDEESTFLKSMIFQLGHKIALGETILEPSLAYFDINDAPWRIDINLLAHFFEEKFTVGGSYRLSEGPFDPSNPGDAGLLMGLQVTAFKIYYSYNYSLLQFQSYNGGSHEVSIAFDFKGDDNSKRRRRRRKF